MNMVLEIIKNSLKSLFNKNKSINKIILLNGLYKNKKNEYIRFYADGLVQGITMIGKPKEVLYFLSRVFTNDIVGYGFYITDDNGNISFYIESKEGIVEYKGTIENKNLTLTSYSHINNKSFSEVFTFIEIW